MLGRAVTTASVATLLGPRDALWIITSVFIIAALVLLTDPIRRPRDLPTAEQSDRNAAMKVAGY